MADGVLGGARMPPLSDKVTIDKLLLAYDERSSGGVQWKPKPASEWLRRELEGYSEPEINDLVYDHILNGGKILVAAESREEFLHCKCHYDFHISLPDSSKILYIETTLMDARMGPLVTVVNVHWAD